LGGWPVAGAAGIAVVVWLDGAGPVCRADAFPQCVLRERWDAGEQRMLRGVWCGWQRDNSEVIDAPDGEAALAEFKKMKPDIVISDVFMPKMDGFELCQEIRKLDKNVPIVMLTSMNDVQDRIKVPSPAPVAACPPLPPHAAPCLGSACD